MISYMGTIWSGLSLATFLAWETLSPQKWGTAGAGAPSSLARQVLETHKRPHHDKGGGDGLLAIS